MKKELTGLVDITRFKYDRVLKFKPKRGNYTMSKFVEKKSVLICQHIILYMGLFLLLSIFLAIFWHEFLFGILILPCSIPFLLFSTFASKRDEYTRNFLKLMRQCLDEATTLQDLKNISDDFRYYAVKDGMYCLSFPGSLRNIQQEINSKIEILEKQP